MDNTLKAAYAALEKWKKNVTVKDFVRDNKRLNSVTNPNSPTLSEFMHQTSTTEIKAVSRTTKVEINEYFGMYSKLFSTSHKSTFDYFLNQAEIINQISSLERNLNLHAMLSEGTSQNVVSILVKRKKDQVFLTRSNDKFAAKNIEDLFSLEEKTVPRSHSSNEILRSYMTQQYCGA